MQRDDEAFAGAVRIKVVVVLFDGDKPKPDQMCIRDRSSLTTILDNPHYVGDTVLGRTLNAIYKGVKNQHIDREEWIVFPNTHEVQNDNERDSWK